MQTIIVTAIGSSSAKVIIEQLKLLNYRVIGLDIYPKSWHIESNMVDIFIQAPKASDFKNYLNTINDAISTYNAKFLLPLTDVEVDVLAPIASNFKEKGCTLLALQDNIAELCRNKYKMMEWIKTHSFCESIPCCHLENYKLTPDFFPLIIKPINGRSSQGIMHAKTLEEFLDLYPLIPENSILQPFISGNIFTVDVARDIFGNVKTLPRCEWLRTVHGLGTTVQTYINHPLNDICKNIANNLNFVGVVNIEFIQKDDKYYFLEVNPRFSGGLAFSLLAGMNFIEMQLNSHTGKSIQNIGSPKNCILTTCSEAVITQSFPIK